MGLKIKNYKNEKLGITLPTAYAQIQNVNIQLNGRAHANFKIQQDRESITEKESLDIISFSCAIDKDLPIFSQIYIKAKESVFSGWEDDIVEE